MNVVFVGRSEYEWMLLELGPRFLEAHGIVPAESVVLAEEKFALVAAEQRDRFESLKAQMDDLRIRRRRTHRGESMMVMMLRLGSGNGGTKA